MKKKILALAIASSLAVPQVALAAEDTAGMHFTSASEGFYASIRAQVSSAAVNGQDANLNGGSSRFGVTGTNDLGGGLEGFYTYEAGVDIANGGGLSTRLGNVGLRGGFGEVIAGSFWVNSYNWTYGGTDIANVNSGSLAYNADLPARQSKAVQYTSPDLNGFQVSGNLTFDGDSASTKNDVDQWAISAKYDIQGFSLGASYLNRPDALPKSIAVTYAVPAGGTAPAPVLVTTGTADSGVYVLKGGYSQDNWYVTGWYGQDSSGDVSITVDGSGATGISSGTANVEDTEFYSIAGGVSINKIDLYALYENRDASAQTVAGKSSLESSLGTLGVQYKLGAKSRVYLEYATRDDDAVTTESDNVVLGLRHDF